ncbi:MAG: class I poly(R)-hydroxyalkanoic acid synthase [Burkholderiales bacterium]
MDQPTNDSAQLLTAWMRAGQEAMQYFNLAMGSGTPSASGASANDTTDPVAQFIATATSAAKLQLEAFDNIAGFWMRFAGLPGAGGAVGSAGINDRRFANEAWGNDPRFDLVRRAYLAYSNFLESSVEQTDVDERTKGQLRFGIRQFLDAMSPSNFLATNPEATQLAIESGGQSLTEGMALYFQDLARGRVSMTDENAFVIGENLAVTPGAVVYENEMMQLIQYAPTTKEVFERPLVIIPPCVNKFYILDLQPENSFIRHSIGAGHTVFVVSWRQITADLGHLTWDDYLSEGVMRAIDVALSITGESRVNALGFCVGGTLLASALAVMATRGEDKVASLTLLTTLLDFTDTGELGLLVSEEAVAAREASIGSGGILPGKEMAFTFSALRANDLIWQYVTNSYLKGKAPPAFDLLYWNADSTNLAGPMVTWFLRNAYLENKLAQAGKTIQCGIPMDLAAVHVPTFLYASRDDHIVPWKTAYQSTRLLGGDTTFLLGASGHIAGVINPPAKGKRNYWIDGAQGDDPDGWLSTAHSVPGSWWPHWYRWLAPLAGEQGRARMKLGSKKYPVIEPAPGRYVLVKAD